MSELYSGKLAVLCQNSDELSYHQELAQRLSVPVRIAEETVRYELEPLLLTRRDGCLKLLDHELLKQGGMYVEVLPRPGEQKSWPAPKDGVLAQALGRKTQTVVDTTAGWGQDSLHIFRMGYDLVCLERSPVMGELLADGFKRLLDLDWMQRLALQAPGLIRTNAIQGLAQLAFVPECVFMDPMFPPKRKKSALARKSMRVLHELLGDDEDKQDLFMAAWQSAGKRVVVKTPDYAEPLGGKPSVSYQGKLVRYDVYLKNG